MMTPEQASSEERKVLHNKSFLDGERPIQTQVKEFFAEDRGGYIVEWGVRITDRALIFHFYPPKEVGGWHVEYGMPNRIKLAIDGTLDVDRVTCGYVDEMASFFIIAGGYGRGFDQRPIVKRLLDALDAADV